MEILINIPPFLHPIIELLTRYWLSLLTGWQTVLDAVTASQETAHRMMQMPYSNVVIPVTAVLLVFWPILLSLVMAIATAWAWFFWLATSMILGVIQVGYASYQFFMITMDICGLSMLKTYTIVRNQCFYLLFQKGSRRNSRRRIWRRQLDQAGNYESFLKIRIEPKDVQQIIPRLKPDGSIAKVDAALSDVKIPRSSSFSFMNASPSSKMPRNRSFSGELAAAKQLQQQHLEHDPIITLELGPKTADLLLTTTWRLERARSAAERNPNDLEAASALKYLLSGVVKRNHLQLEDVMVNNARSIAESGQYGVSTQSRQMIRAYYQEVEKCLDWVADSPLPQQPQQYPPLHHQPPLEENNTCRDDTIMVDRSPSSFERHGELSDRMRLVRKMKQNTGRTALMLSGGTYHICVYIYIYIGNIVLWD